jgi:UDP-N-acetylglucosamine 2-epimerase (non-hydrolysing)
MLPKSGSLPMKLKIICVVGTRPEAIKMAPVIRELRARPEAFECIVVSTGQHRQMLDQVFGIFGLQPDIDLGLMQPNQSLAGLTAALFTHLDKVINEAQPDWILAQGDTTSVMVASLVAFYRRIRFGHVEAGLRTGDFAHPFPEELNRRIADLTGAACFAPTQKAASALRAEGVSPEKIHITGNTVVDALQQIIASGELGRVQLPVKLLPGRRIVLVTAHRRESFGEPFRQLCHALRELASKHEHVQFVYPVHLNPNVRRPVHEILGEVRNVHLIEPVDYVQLIALMKRAELILTDSGGIQEEAPTFGVPVLVMRETTERPEGVEVGAVQLVGTQQRNIVEAAEACLTGGFTHWNGANPYGDGQASRRIADVLAAAKS